MSDKAKLIVLMALTSAPVAATVTGALGAVTVYLLGGPLWAAFGIGWLGFLVTLWGHK